MSRKPSVLVVAGDTVLVEDIRSVLQRTDCEIRVADTGHAALDVLSEGPRPVVLLDLETPGICESGLLSEIARSSPTTRIIAIHGPDALYDAARAVKDQAFACLAKPVDPHELQTSAHRAFESHSAEQKYRDLVDLLPQVIFEFDLNGRFTFMNKNGLAAFGYSEDDLIGKLGPLDLIIPEDRERATANIGGLMDGEMPRGNEYIALRKDGTTFPIVVNAAPIVRDDGVVGARGIVVDTSQVKAAERAFREYSQFVQTVISGVSEGVIVYDREFKYVMWNAAMERMTGVPAWQVLGRYPPDVFPHVREYGLRRLFDQAMSGKSISSPDILITAPQAGKSVWVSYSYAPLSGSEGTITGVVAVVRDITERKRAEVLLRESEEQHRAAYETLQQLIDASPLAILGLDLDGKIVTWNPACERMFGWTQEEALGGPTPIVPEDKRDEFDASFQQVIRGTPIAGWEVRRKRKDGVLIDLSLSVTPVRSDDEIVGVMATAEDITEPKRLEGQIRQAQRLEAAGRLAGGLAHDFKNFLMGISGLAEILQMKLGADHPEVATVDDLLLCVDKAAKLVNQLQAFSRRQPIAARPTDLRELVEEFSPLFAHILGETIAMKLDFDPDTGIVSVDPGQIEQVLLNMVVNARDAMPDGGTLTIRTKNVRVEDEPRPKRTGLKPGEYVRLVVADTGIGMDEATRDRVFEPYFTTKEAGDRSGLGLAVSYGIIRQHKGHIEVSSKPGKGTQFSVFLPLTNETDADKSTAQPVSPRGGTETILIADDEEMVRLPMKAALEGYGYTVLSASDGEEALALFAENWDAVDLAILDVVMPKAGGKPVWRSMSKAKPGLKALFISGYGSQGVSKHDALPREAPFLPKPFSMRQLASKVRELLDQRVIPL